MTLSTNMRAALFMMLSMTGFTVNDAFMKAGSDEIGFFQGIFVRGLMITAGLVVLGLVRGTLHIPVPRRDRGLIALRSGAEVVGTLLFLSALYRMEFANVSAILQALPLTVTLAAALFFGEPVGWRRLVAIGIGFIGVLLIVQPGTNGFNAWSLLALAAVLVITVRDLSARRLSPQVPTIKVAIAAAIAVTLMAGLGTILQGWNALTLLQLSRLAAAALCLMAGYMAAVQAMRSGEIGFVAPFRYTSLIVSLVLGLLVFDQFPNNVKLLGAAIVVATGLFTIYREQRLKA